MESAHTVNNKRSQAGQAIAAQFSPVGEGLILPFRTRVSRTQYREKMAFLAQSANSSANHSAAF